MQYPGYKFTWSYESESEQKVGKDERKISDALEQIYKKKGIPEAHYKELLDGVKKREAETGTAFQS